MKAEINHGGKTEEIVFPENTVFVNFMTEKYNIICMDNHDIASFFGLDAILYERDFGGLPAKLYAWIDRDGALADEIRHAYEGMETIHIEDGDASLKITV